MLFSRLSYLSLSQEPGVYFFLDKNDKILYIGKANNLKNRVSSYFSNQIKLGEKTKLLVSKIEKIKIILVNSEIESLLLEANCIKKYKPEFNIKLMDGKNYPLIKITIKDEYPKVLITRRIEESDSLYFGPYPSASSMYLVLKMLRKIFPYQSSINHTKRICLYNHLGLCPCPPIFQSPEFNKQYRKNIKHICNFLNGKIKNVISDLHNERENLSKLEKFEQAMEVQKKINAIEQVTKFFYKPFEYETNPNFKKDLRETELNELKNLLTKSNINIEKLIKIECFDISNTSGNLSTGSMVVFIQGEMEKPLYRRFKIKTKGPNDFEMIKEVLERRLKHKEWILPELIIVDGGKGQVSSAIEALKSSGINIPLIGLAKRNEEIITSDFKKIILPKDSKALHLLMRIRDEAHRFAIAYHKKLRSKFLIHQS